MAAAIMICRCTRASAPSRPAAPPLFLDDDNGFRLIQATPQCRNLTVGLSQLGLQRIDGHFLRTAMAWLQCAQ
jgi:hypothetical protein